jgi:hypothetical protein
MEIRWALWLNPNSFVINQMMSYEYTNAYIPATGKKD